MKSIILISIIILNLFSIFMLYKMLKGTDTKFRIVTTIVLIIVNMILVNIIYGIGKIGIAEEIAKSSKNLIFFTMLPINLIVMASPMAVQISKARLEEIEKEKFFRNIIICLIIDVVILCLECNYIKSIQLGIERMATKNL